MKISFVCTELTTVKNYSNLKRKAEKLPVNYGGLKQTSIPPTSEDAFLTHAVRS